MYDQSPLIGELNNDCELSLVCSIFVFPYEGKGLGVFCLTSDEHSSWHIVGFQYIFVD